MHLPRALKSGTVATSWREATIAVIHKDGKDPTKCRAYRPISLLNADLRILTPILARHVNKITTEITHPFYFCNSERNHHSL